MWAPQCVKFFHWGANLDRCWTAARLRRRCLLRNQEMETMQHLLTACPFSQLVWSEILSWLRMTYRPSERSDTLPVWWSRAKQATLKLLRRGLASLELFTPWMVWKHRNRCVFNWAHALSPPSVTSYHRSRKKQHSGPEPELQASV
jgi:hypothetical protein